MALRIFFFILLNTEIGAASGRSMEPSYQGDEDKADVRDPEDFYLDDLDTGHGYSSMVYVVQLVAVCSVVICLLRMAYPDHLKL